MLAFVTPKVWGADHHVPADFPSIQAALDAAAEGDRVIVDPGRYYEAIIFPARALHLKSSGGPAVTIIDALASNTVVTFENAPGRGAILEGFTITNGLDPKKVKAGGVHVGEGGSPVIRGNVIRQNRGYGFGHGVSLYRPGSPLIEANEIRHNRSGPDRTGGGGGGGIGIYGSTCLDAPGCVAEVRGNYIGNNYVTAYTDGGGIYLNGASANIVGNVIEFNTASNSGGGLSSVNGSPALVENNLFRDNLAGSFGGGIDSSVSFGDRGPWIINNTFVDNAAPTGSAISTSGFDSEARIGNNLIVANVSGTALDCASGHDHVPPPLRNNNVHAPVGLGYGGLCADQAGRNGNLSQAPRFAGEADFRLLPGSAGVDAGDGSLSSQSLDLSGSARFADGDGDGRASIDIGAYELSVSALFADGFESIE